MSDVSEQDLERLEEYLDDALAPEDVEHLRIRLAEDPSVVAALDELRSERSARAAVWSTLEPTDAEARQFARKVSTEARRQDLWARVGHHARFGSAAAACVLVGLFLGWMGRERGPAGDTLPTFQPRGVNVLLGRPAMTATRQETHSVQIDEIRYSEPPHPSQPTLMIRRIVPPHSDLREGDQLLLLDGVPLRDVPSLVEVLGSRKGQRILRILRGGHVHDIRIDPQQQ